MKIRQLRLFMQLNIGQLNEKRTETLRNVLREHFPMTGKAELGNGQAFLNPRFNEVLLVHSDHIMYQLDNLTTAPNFEKIQQVLQIIFDSLLLDDQITGHTYMLGLEDTQGNSFERTLRLPIDTGDWPALMGTGLRFFTNHGQDIWEFKLEPFVQDPSKFFLDALCNHANVPLQAFIELATEAYTEFIHVSEEHLGKLMAE